MKPLVFTILGVIPLIENVASVPIVNTCADTLQYLSAYGANSNEICMSMVGQDNFDGSKTINLDCGLNGFATVEECLKKDTPIGTAVMQDCCGTPTIDLSSSTCADTNDPELCSGRDGSLNSDKSLSGLNVECSTFATVSDCVNYGPDSDTFKDHCCDVSDGTSLPFCGPAFPDKSNCCDDGFQNSHCAWTGDACVEIENLGGNTDQCGVDDSFSDSKHMCRNYSVPKCTWVKFERGVHVYGWTGQFRWKQSY